MGFKEFEADDELQVEEPEERRELSRFMQRLAGMKEDQGQRGMEGENGQGSEEAKEGVGGVGVKEEEGGKGKEDGQMDSSATSAEGGQSGSGDGTTGVTARRRSLRNKA